MRDGSNAYNGSFRRRKNKHREPTLTLCTEAAHATTPAFSRARCRRAVHAASTPVATARFLNMIAAVTLAACVRRLRTNQTHARRQPACDQTGNTKARTVGQREILHQ